MLEIQIPTGFNMPGYEAQKRAADMEHRLAEWDAQNVKCGSTIPQIDEVFKGQAVYRPHNPIKVVGSPDNTSLEISASGGGSMVPANEQESGLVEKQSGAEEAPQSILGDDEPKHGYGKAVIGEKVWKKFGRRFYFGEVVGFDPDTKWYKVVYEDDDQEELSWWELVPIMLQPPASYKRPRPLPKEKEETPAKRMRTDDQGSKEKDQSKSLPEKTPAELIGAKTMKKFCDKFYSGEVISYDPKAKYYKIHYEDGDEEELDWDELRPTMVATNEKDTPGNGAMELLFDAMEMAGEGTEEREGPSWLKNFIFSDFFRLCNCQMNDVKPSKHELKYYCITCQTGPLCLTAVENTHDRHSLLQVRKSSKEYTIKVEDIKQFVNLGAIQHFFQNKGSVVFLRKRTPQRTRVMAPGHCNVCNRSLMETTKRFCSIECKLSAIKEPRSGEDLELTFVKMRKAGEDGPDPLRGNHLRPKSTGRQSKHVKATTPVIAGESTVVNEEPNGLEVPKLTGRKRQSKQVRWVERTVSSVNKGPCMLNKSGEDEEHMHADGGSSPLDQAHLSFEHGDMDTYKRGTVKQSQGTLKDCYYYYT